MTSKIIRFVAQCHVASAKTNKALHIHVVENDTILTIYLYIYAQEDIVPLRID